MWNQVVPVPAKPWVGNLSLQEKDLAKSLSLSSEHSITHDVLGPVKQWCLR